MPPIYRLSGELYGYTSMPNEIDVDFLLPNGFLITIKLSRDTSLSEIKKKIWIEAKNYPLFDYLKPQSNYILVSVSQDAKNVEYYDEKKRICDLKLFHPFFKLIEVHGNLEEKSLNWDISKAIGICNSEIEKIDNNEIIEYRYSLFSYVNDLLVKNNKTNDNHNRNYKALESVYAANIELSANSLLEMSINETTNRLLHNIENLNFNNNIHVDIHVRETNQRPSLFHLTVSLNSTPIDLISQIIREKLAKIKYNPDKINDVVLKFKNFYFLNICGCDELLYGDKNQISSYKYIHWCIEHKKKPSFHLTSIDTIKSKLPVDDYFIKAFFCKQLEKKQQFDKIDAINNSTINPVVSWNVHERFQMYLKEIVYMQSLKNCEKLYFKMAVCHGQDRISDTRESKYLDFIPSAIVHRWFQTIEFNINVSNIHRCSRVCIVLYCVAKKKRESVPLGWISLNIFDYKGYLISGNKEFYLWPVSQQSFEYLCSSEATGQNPNINFLCIKVEFPQYKQFSKIAYPTFEQIRTHMKSSTDKSYDECFDCDDALENNNELLDNILKKDILAEFPEQYKRVIWKRRLDCLKRPNSLPKVLQSLMWSQKDDVIEAYKLLDKWPKIKPFVAIELLQNIYDDIEVRNFAVKCLDEHMKDEEVQQYLLQFVQILKREPYLNNSLTKFLLNRAFKSQRIGMDLFWLLKTEMNDQKFKYRFGILLEAYCRGIGTSIRDLLKQIDAIEKLSVLTDTIKENREDMTILKGSYLNEMLEKPDYNEALSNITSPLSRSHILGKIMPSKCKIFSSKKCPIYLVWQNGSEYAELYEETFDLIFKQGDDLRQDMLTLQVIKLMDIIWKSNGLDLKMIIYQAYSSGVNTGFIQVIKNSLTIFKIQMAAGKRAAYQIDTSQLYKWISENNPNTLNEAVSLFTKSCAGYCVATFILGIGDRHPDNIMVNKNGQLFHIDYGHFLGHFKKKYGIKRERVPFVLTEDFTRVISYGSSYPTETLEFKKFSDLCEHAYMIIRAHANLIINIFTLMLSSDMPELRTVNDIMYLRKTLLLDESDDKAREFFRSQLEESCKFSFTTKFDWMCHAIRHKNLV